MNERLYACSRCFILNPGPSSDRRDHGSSLQSRFLAPPARRRHGGSPAQCQLAPRLLGVGKEPCGRYLRRKCELGVASYQCCTLVDAASVRRDAPRSTMLVRSKPVGPACQRKRPQAPLRRRRPADPKVARANRPAGGPNSIIPVPASQIHPSPPCKGRRSGSFRPPAVRARRRSRMSP